jgi:thiol-disulfide isomerase/thioredoxin
MCPEKPTEPTQITEAASTAAPPARNPVPMIVAAVAAVVILAGLVIVLVNQGDDDSAADYADGLLIDPNGEADSLAGSSPGDGPAPDVTFDYFDGSDGSLDDFEGRPLVVNFFASWCGPCVTEMPEFEEVHQQYADEVAFLGLNTQDALEDGMRIADDTGVTYALAHDPDGSVFGEFEGFAMPTTVFVDADGSITRLHAGILPGDDLAEIIETDLLS